MCTKWLPIDNVSGFCSADCEISFKKEAESWERYKERYRQEGIQRRMNNRNEHNKCLNCGDPILQKDKGRFRRYCDNDCKQEAYRKRQKLQEVEKEKDNNKAI